MDDLIALVGKSTRSPQVKSFLVSEALIPEDFDDFDNRKLKDWSSKAKGYVLHQKRGRIEAIHIYVVRAEGYKAFTGPLTHGLTPGDGRAQIYGKFGEPTRTGATEPHPEFGEVAGWDRYDSAEVCIHFGYRQDGPGIRLITLMAPDVAP
jgi:hypothetical protein